MQYDKNKNKAERPYRYISISNKPIKTYLNHMPRIQYEYAAKKTSHFSYLDYYLFFLS